MAANDLTDCGNRAQTTNARPLGIFGAGGIGFYIQNYVRAFQYEKVATLTFVIVAFIVLIELANNAIRTLLR